MSRQFTFEIAAGTSGSGKTYMNKIIIENYIKNINLPVLIFDVNGEYTSYGKSKKEIITLDFDVKEENAKKRGEIFRQFSQAKPFIARVIPRRKDGSPMTTAEMQTTYRTMARNFVGGMLVLDDILHYERGFRSQEALGIANTLRHGKDLLLSFQSIVHLQDVLWGVVKFVRMHKLSADPFTIKDRIPDLLPIEVCYLLIEQAYRRSYQYITEQLEITLDEYQGNVAKFTKRQRREADGIFTTFWIRINPAKIENISKEQFAEGVKLYYQKYFPREITKEAKFRKVSNDEALDNLIERNMHYI